MSQMGCVQMILSNMSFSCSMDRLVSSPVPENSPLYLPPDRSAQCLGMSRYYISKVLACINPGLSCSKHR